MPIVLKNMFLSAYIESFQLIKMSSTYMVLYSLADHHNPWDPIDTNARTRSGSKKLLLSERMPPGRPVNPDSLVPPVLGLSQ